jgi:hypothetical protein
MTLWTAHHDEAWKRALFDSVHLLAAFVGLQASMCVYDFRSLVHPPLV